MFLRRQWLGITFGLVILLSFSCTETNDKKQSNDSSEKNSSGSLNDVLKPVSSNVLSKINIVNPVNKLLPIYTEASGYLDYDNYEKWDVSSRYSGRIEKLYVKYNYQPIKKGDILFEVYSPDLVTAQENLLYILKNSPNDTALLNASRQKLKLLQLTNDQIQQVETSGKVIQAIPVYSKYDGHIHEMLDSKMATNDYQENSLLSIKEGMYVDRGQVLFNVVNPHKIVAMLKIKSDDIGKVKLKQKVSFYVNNDSTMTMNGTVDFIEPMFNDNSKTLMVRVNIDNSKHLLKVGSLVSAKIAGENLQALWISSTAVVDLGKNKIFM